MFVKKFYSGDLNLCFVLFYSAQGDASGLSDDFLQVRKQVGEDFVPEILAPVVLDGAQEILVAHHMHKVGMQCYVQLFFSHFLRKIAVLKLKFVFLLLFLWTWMETIAQILISTCLLLSSARRYYSSSACTARRKYSPASTSANLAPAPRSSFSQAKNIICSVRKRIEIEWDGIYLPFESSVGLCGEEILVVVLVEQANGAEFILFNSHRLYFPHAETVQIGNL
jgi:hypothetical protein